MYHVKNPEIKVAPTMPPTMPPAIAPRFELVCEVEDEPDCVAVGKRVEGEPDCNAVSGKAEDEPDTVGNKVGCGIPVVSGLSEQQ